MILQAVPTEDYDETRPESPSGSRPTLKTRALQSNDFGWRLAAILLCCCLGAAGVVASLAVLARYSDEEAASGKRPRPTASAPLLPLLAVFSLKAEEQLDMMATNSALAWLVAAMLKGHPSDWRRKNVSGSVFVPVSTAPPPAVDPSGGGGGHSEAAAGGADATAVAASAATSSMARWFVPGVEVWRPRMPRGSVAGSSDEPVALAAFLHGAVADILHQQRGLTSPMVRPLDAVGEADALLRLRSLLETEEGTGVRPLVLVSHPHRLPYLAILALSVGLRPQVLDPGLFSAVPWQTFGCGAFGYASSVHPGRQLAAEESRFAAFAEKLRTSDPERFALMAPVLQTANATLVFHRCVASRMAVDAPGHAAQAARDCSAAAARMA